MLAGSGPVDDRLHSRRETHDFGSRSHRRRDAELFRRRMPNIRPSLLGGWNAGWRDDLIDRALPGWFVGPKAEQLGPMAEPVARHVVVPDLDDQLRPQRLPFAAALRAPAARPARRLAAETRRPLQSANLSGQRWPLVIGDRRGEADMVQQALRVVETEQQGADFRPVALVSKASDHAIGGTQGLAFDKRALAAQILSGQPLGDDPVTAVVIEIVEPLRRSGEIARTRRDDELSGNRGLLAEGLERASPLSKGERPHRRAIRPDQHVEQNESRRRFQ